MGFFGDDNGSGDDPWGGGDARPPVADGSAAAANMARISRFVTVTLPSGAPMQVENETEAKIVTDAVAGYTDEFDFRLRADLVALDGVVTSEVICYRLDQFTSWGCGYDGAPVDVDEVMKRLKDRALVLSRQKADLGLDKPTRDKTRGDGSPAKYIQNLLVRARAFGLHREEQLNLALEQLNYIFGEVTAWSNMSDDERRRMDMTADDLLFLFKEREIPKFAKISEYFIEHEQRFWWMDEAA